MRPGPDTAERIRRHEVSRALKKTNLSPEDQEVIDLFSRSLVGRLLHGPIFEVLARAEVEPSLGVDQARKYRTGSKGTEAETNRPGQ